MPAIMSMYLMSGGKGNDKLRDGLLSGDRIPVTLPDDIRSEFMSAKVCSLGGATEGSIWSIYYPIEKVEDGASSIPYGMPLTSSSVTSVSLASSIIVTKALVLSCIL